MTERKQPETLRLRAVMPSLTVGDIERSRDWYRDVLGCIVADEMRREEQLIGVVMRAGDVDLLLGQDDFAKGRDRKKGVGFRLYCVSRQDIDRLAGEIKARGGVLERQPTDQPWGARDFSIVDPDGFRISISTGLED